MIHVLTVHWELDDWVDIQLKYLGLHIREPFRVYAYLNRLKADHTDKFFYSSPENIVSHPEKLNLLAHHVCAGDAAPDDLLIFQVDRLIFDPFEIKNCGCIETH